MTLFICQFDNNLQWQPEGKQALLSLVEYDKIVQSLLKEIVGTYQKFENIRLSMH